MEKVQLLHNLAESRQQMLVALKGIPEAEMVTPGVMADWTIKDLLAHLCVWEGQLVTLLWQAEQGRKPTSVHFSRLTTDELNARFYLENQARRLEQVLSDFHSLRRQTLRRLVAFSDRDLNDPQRYPWTVGEPLWKWIAADTYEHELEHLPQIREWRQQQGI